MPCEECCTPEKQNKTQQLQHELRRSSPAGYPVSLWPRTTAAHYCLVDSHKLSLWFWTQGAKLHHKYCSNAPALWNQGRRSKPWFYVKAAREARLVRAWNRSALCPRAPAECSQQAGLHSLTLLAHTYILTQAPPSSPHNPAANYIPTPLWCQAGFRRKAPLGLADTDRHRVFFFQLNS